MGREKVIFSISVAMALASKMPIQMGIAFFSSRSFRMTIGVLVIGSIVRPDTFISMNMRRLLFLHLPRREWRKASTIRTETVFPISPGFPGKLTIRFPRVRPVISWAHSYSPPRPAPPPVLSQTGAVLLKGVIRLEGLEDPSLSRFTLPHTWRSIPAAAVPSLSEYWNEKRLSNRTSSISASVA